MVSSRLRALLVIATLAVPALASAQSEPPPERHGLFLGGGVYGGNISCNGADCGGFRAAGGGAAHLGYNFAPRLGVVLDVWAMTSETNNVAVTFVSGTVGLRWWLAPVIWVHGGVGNGHAIVRVGPFAGRGDDVPVGHLGIGLEVVRGRNWALAIEARVAQGTSTDASAGVQTGRSAGVGAVASWFGSRR